MSSEQKRAILAVLLSGAVLFIWQSKFAPKTDIKNEQTQTVLKPSVAKQDQTQVAPKQIEVSEDIFEEQEIKLSNTESSYVFNNGFKILSSSNPYNKLPLNEVVGVEDFLEIYVVDKGVVERVRFQFNEKDNEASVTGFDPNFGISLSTYIDEENFLYFSLTSQTAYKYRLIFNSVEGKMDNAKVREFILYNGKEIERIATDSQDEGTYNIKWLGVDFNYHFAGLLFETPMPLVYRTTGTGQFIVDFTNATNSISSQYAFVQKNYDTLKEIGHNLHLAVNFGFFGILAVPILRGLQWIHQYVPNYGIGIIILTLLIRLLTFPLQWKSMKSMKKMQLIQPEMNKIREKFKDDPQKMQAKTMELFKQTGANPMSGCLPLILQMPIFFAFYQVLYNAVELVGSPFFLWISDLSSKDPFYVLPVLMAITMFAQQKLMPSTTADPTQKKIMMFLPVIFGFIMKDLPSGLTLYIFISTLFGIVQQLFVNKKVA